MSKWMKWQRVEDYVGAAMPRCEAIDGDGARCRKQAQWVGPYKGDDLHAPLVPMVVVHLCGSHAALVK